MPARMAQLVVTLPESTNTWISIARLRCRPTLGPSRRDAQPRKVTRGTTSARSEALALTADAHEVEDSIGGEVNWDWSSQVPPISIASSRCSALRASRERGESREVRGLELVLTSRPASTKCGIQWNANRARAERAEVGNLGTRELRPDADCESG